MCDGESLDKSLSPAVTRAIEILDYLAAKPGEAISSSEIARELRLPKSSANNLCLTLERQEMVERSSSGYMLGPHLVELGGRYLSATDPVREFYRAVEKSPGLAQETCRLAVLRGTDVMYLGCANGTQPLRMMTNIGDRLPASATATGKAIYALTDTHFVAERYSDVGTLPALTERSVRTVPELLEAVSHVRKQGFAVDDQETTPGVSCLAVAFVAEDQSAYGISVTVLSVRWNDALVSRLLPELRAVANRLRHRMRPGGIG